MLKNSLGGDLNRTIENYFVRVKHSTNMKEHVDLISNNFQMITVVKYSSDLRIYEIVRTFADSIARDKYPNFKYKIVFCPSNRLFLSCGIIETSHLFGIKEGH